MKPELKHPSPPEDYDATITYTTIGIAIGILICVAVGIAFGIVIEKAQHITF